MKKSKGEVTTKTDRREYKRIKRRAFLTDNRRSVRIIAKQGVKSKR